MSSITTPISQKILGNQDGSISAQTSGEIDAKLFLYKDGRKMQTPSGADDLASFLRGFEYPILLLVFKFITIIPSIIFIAEVTPSIIGILNSFVSCVAKLLIPAHPKMIDSDKLSFKMFSIILLMIDLAYDSFLSKSPSP